MKTKIARYISNAVALMFVVMILLCIMCLMLELISTVFSEDDPGSWQRAVKETLWWVRDQLH